jgi:hypothetical protein
MSTAISPARSRASHLGIFRGGFAPAHLARYGGTSRCPMTPVPPATNTRMTATFLIPEN